LNHIGNGGSACTQLLSNGIGTHFIFLSITQGKNAFEIILFGG